MNINKESQIYYNKLHILEKLIKKLNNVFKMEIVMIMKYFIQ